MNKSITMTSLKDYDPMTGTERVPSPCINVCEMNPQTGLCKGCFRTINEIAQWSMATESVRRATWKEINRRKTQKA